VFVFLAIWIKELIFPRIPQALNELPLFIATVSLLTSITSLIGFISTTVLAWRKERREARSADLDIKRKELEIQKLQQELGGGTVNDREG